MSDLAAGKTTKIKFTEETSKASKLNALDEASETEIFTEIIVPEEGHYGWFVVAGSFMCIFILEGIFLTFGSIYKDMSNDMEIEISLVTLINSIAMALYFIAGPAVSALVNRFGFRICTMMGSILISFAYLTSSLVGNYIFVLLFYGIVSGIGGCLINMSSLLVVGFYFERLRAIAMSIAGLGSSFGITIMSRVNNYLVPLAGWRTVTLLHAGLFGMIYFIAMLFRPLLSLSVNHEKDDIQTVTYLPSLSTVAIKDGTESEPVMTTRTEKLFSAVSNAHFPTVAEVVEVEADTMDINEPGPSPTSKEKLTFTARLPQGDISPRQLKQVQSILSRRNLQDNEKFIEINVDNIQAPKKHRWWSRCCHWEHHVDESRPMYRDDAFYNGRVENLQVYKEHVLSSRQNKKSGFEYQMAVTRATAAEDLEQRRGIFTLAIRRVLATMLDPQLLRRNSFFMISTTGFLVHLGIIIPYMFLADRNKSEGIDEVHCNSFVSVMGLSNAVGRLVAGFLACKFCPIKLYSLGCIMAGTGMIISNFLFNVYYQYFCCVMFAFSTAHISALRSLVLVDLYGLDNLTNATGILLMFQGFGCLISTPLSGAVKNKFGFKYAFYLAGTFIVLGGLISINVKRIAKSERRAKARQITGKYSSVIKRKKKSKSKQSSIVKTK